MAHGYCVANLLSGLASTAITTTASVVGGVSSYVNDGRLGRTWILTAIDIGDGSAFILDIKIDLGSALSFQCAAWLNTSGVPADASVQLYSDTDGTFDPAPYQPKGNTAFTPTDAVDKKDFVLQFPASTSYRWLLMRIVRASVFTVSIGELFVGASITSLSREGVYGSGEGEEVIAVSSRMQGGDVRVAKFGGPIAERRYSFADWTAAQLAEAKALWRATNGPVTPLLWIDKVAQTTDAATAAEMRCLYGRIQDARFDWTQDDFGVYQPPGLILRSSGRELGS
jgi:hypothetical protein